MSRYNDFLANHHHFNIGATKQETLRNVRLFENEFFLNSVLFFPLLIYCNSVFFLTLILILPLECVQQGLDHKRSSHESHKHYANFGVSGKFHSFFFLGCHFDMLQLFGEEDASVCQVTYRWSNGLATCWECSP